MTENNVYSASLNQTYQAHFASYKSSYYASHMFGISRPKKLHVYWQKARERRLEAKNKDLKVSCTNNSRIGRVEESDVETS